MSHSERYAPEWCRLNALFWYIYSTNIDDSKYWEMYATFWRLTNQNQVFHITCVKILNYNLWYLRNASVKANPSAHTDATNISFFCKWICISSKSFERCLPSPSLNESVCLYYSLSLETLSCKSELHLSESEAKFSHLILVWTRHLS